MTKSSSRQHDPELEEVLESLRQASRKAHELHARSTEQLGYIVQAADEFAVHLSAINSEPVTPETSAAVEHGKKIGQQLRTQLGKVEAAGELAAEAVRNATHLFATGVAVGHTMSTSFGLPTVVAHGFYPDPFTTDSGPGKYARLLEQCNSQLGRTYRDAWAAFYSLRDDPARAALWQMRQVFDHFFHILAPSDTVGVADEATAEDRPTRADRIRFAAEKWIPEHSSQLVLNESAQATVDAYQRLQQAHSRQALDFEKARQAFESIDTILRRWVDAIRPWPPRTGV